jgi:hypothetical protein
MTSFCPLSLQTVRALYVRVLSSKTDHLGTNDSLKAMTIVKLIHMISLCYVEAAVVVTNQLTAS